MKFKAFNEDVAAWGVARKTFQFSQGGDYTTVRRAWGRWEGSHVSGPKITYSLTYNNYNMICENCIGTWSGERMKQTYTLLNYDGNPHTSGGSEVKYTNYGVDHPYGIFAFTRLDGSDKNARTKLLGSVAYVRGSDRFAPSQVIFGTTVGSVELANTAVYIQPGTNTSKIPFSLNNVGANLIARNLTNIGGAASHYTSDWNKSSIAEGSSQSSVPNVFTSTSGANLCHRYKDGVLTSERLWPWPMNQRIIDAMVDSGRATVDVTNTIESMFGPIPSTCKTSQGPGLPATVPRAPSNLIVHQR